MIKKFLHLKMFPAKGFCDNFVVFSLFIDYFVGERSLKRKLKFRYGAWNRFQELQLSSQAT